MTKTRRIERNSGVAIWRQIADEIRGEIRAGRLQSGARMPAEMELADRFGVNRHTVRSAIAALTQEGVLRAEQGRGTFVANAKRLTYQIGRRTRISQSLASQVRDMKGALLASGTAPASPDIAEALEIEPGSPVLRLETLHSADGRPCRAQRSGSVPNNFRKLPRIMRKAVPSPWLSEKQELPTTSVNRQSYPPAMRIRMI